MLGGLGLSGVGPAVAAGGAPPCALARTAAVFVWLGPVHLTVGEVLRHLRQMAVAALLLLAQRLWAPPMIQAYSVFRLINTLFNVYAQLRIHLVDDNRIWLVGETVEASEPPERNVG